MDRCLAMFDTQFRENRSKPLHFRRILNNQEKLDAKHFKIFLSFILQQYNLKQSSHQLSIEHHTFLEKKKHYKTGDETIW